MNDLERAKAAFGMPGMPDEDEHPGATQAPEIEPQNTQPDPPIDAAGTNSEVIARTIGRLRREQDALLRPANQLSIRNEPPIERKLREARARGLARAIDIIAQERSGQAPRS